MKPTSKLRGIRGPIPSGHILGRSDAGSGDPHLIKLSGPLAINPQTHTLGFSLGGDVGMGNNGAVTVAALLGMAIDPTPPTNGQKLTYDSGTGTLKWT